MHRNELRTLIGSSLLAVALLATAAVTPGYAQNTPAAGVQGDATTVPDDNDGGMDLGWLGLLGLAGLLGLRRKDDVHVTRVDTTTGTATGSTRPRI